MRWKVTVKEPVVDGERLLVVDFLENTACNVYARNTPSFRIVCAKKSKEVRGINHEGRIQQKVLDCFSGSMWWNGYVLISPREEKLLQRFLKSTETGNHQLDNLWKWVMQTREYMKTKDRKERGELMDEDYRLCPEALPEGMIDYIRREVLPEDRVIIYKKGNVQGTCSVCGRKVHARGRRFVQGTRVNCPNAAQGSCVLENGSASHQITLKISLRCRRERMEKRCSSGNGSCIGITRQDGEHIEDFLQETVRYAIRGNKNSQMAKAGEGILLYAYRAVRAGRMDQMGKTTVFMTAVISSIPVG